MDYEEYRRRFVVDPPPPSRYEFVGLHDAAVYVEEFDAAVEYYTQVLGPPAYVEGRGTRSWMLGDSWLTLLAGKHPKARGVELIVRMKTPAEAERLQGAFIEAGGTGEPPSDQIMIEPLRYCPVEDPFGVQYLIISSL